MLMSILWMRKWRMTSVKPHRNFAVKQRLEWEPHDFEGSLPCFSRGHPFTPLPLICMTDHSFLGALPRFLCSFRGTSGQLCPGSVDFPSRNRSLLSVYSAHE